MERKILLVVFICISVISNHAFAQSNAATESTQVWNDLEITKLVVSASVPLLIVGVGWWINGRIKHIEQLHWASQKVIEKRMSVFEEMAPLLNDLLCYFTYVGCWKELSPPEVIKIKRQLDRFAHVNAPLFPGEFLEKYNGFIDLCYENFSGWGQDAKLRTLTQRRREVMGNKWESSWDNCFVTTNRCPEPIAIRDSYNDLMCCFSRELGVGLEPDNFPIASLPSNIK